MKVATKLYAAFALFAALLATVLLLHVRAVRSSVESGRALSELSSRLRLVSDVEPVRLADLSGTARRYLTTGDEAYRRRFSDLARAQSEELARLDSLPLGSEERQRLATLTQHWNAIEPPALDSATSKAGALDALARLELSLDVVRLDTQRMAAATRAELDAGIERAQQMARDAEDVAWFGGMAALVLGLVLATGLARTVMSPLRNLSRGTTEIAAGRLGYRLDVRGDDELAQVAREFNGMATQLEEIDRVKRDFVSNVSHDLKTPLASMRETTAALLDGLAGPVTPQQRRLLELHRDSSARLAAMLGKLLELSRLEAQPTPRFELCDIGSVVLRAVERADAAAAVLGVVPTIIFAEPDAPILVRADATGIEQVLDNLLENAIKFSGDRTPRRVWVRVGIESVEAGTALITVADEGVGIPATEKHRVFERFQQSREGRGVGLHGVGLGLAICKSIVATHQGRIWAEDNIPCGTIMKVVLPGVVSIARDDAQTVREMLTGVTEE